MKINLWWLCCITLLLGLYVGRWYGARNGHKIASPVQADCLEKIRKYGWAADETGSTCWKVVDCDKPYPPECRGKQEVERCYQWGSDSYVCMLEGPGLEPETIQCEPCSCGNVLAVGYTDSIMTDLQIEAFNDCWDAATEILQ